MELIVCGSLAKHLNENDLFTPTQQGYRNGLSCDTQLVE